MRRIYQLLVMGGLSLSAMVHGDAPGLMEQYVRALQQQDSGALAELFSPDAKVRVTLLMGREAPMIISLTREEYLQQQRALWNFASGYALTVNNLKTLKETQDLQVTFDQKERYRLLQGTLDRDSHMILRVEAHEGKSTITEIHADITQR